MATEIGSLLIDMRADVARLAQDMAKAQNTVEGAMKNVQRSAAAAVTALGLIGVGVSVAGMANVVKGAVGAMAALDDMAARAGTTVEKMSALVDVAKIGGHDIGTMEGAMVRLTKALAGGDEEAKGAGRALATLGLKADELRGMDTADAMLAVAKALAQYENSAGKTALMLDLLGKSGAAAIPYLEDLAEAGELVAKVTREQAEEAEKLEKNFGRIKVAADDMVRSLTVPLVSALSDVVKNFNAARDAGYGFWQAATGIGVRGLGEGVGDAKANAGKRIQELQAEIANHQRDKKFMTDRGDTQGARGYDAEIAAAQRRITYYKTLQRMAIDEQWSGTSHLDARDLAVQGKGSLAGYTSKDDKDPKKKKSNFDPEGDFDLKFAQMQERKRREGFDENERSAKAEADAIEKLRQKYIEMADPLQRYRVQLDEINLLREKGVLSTEQAIEAEWAVNEAMDKAFDTMKNTGEAMKENSNFARDMGMSFTSAFEDAVIGGKKASDVIRGLGQDIGRIIMRKSITEPFGNAVSGFMKNIDFGNLFKAEGGPVTGGQSYIVGERGPEWFTPATSGTITPNHQLAAGGTTNHFTVDMRGASVEAVARLEQLVLSVNGSIERRALNVMGQARVRGV